MIQYGRYAAATAAVTASCVIGLFGCAPIGSQLDAEGFSICQQYINDAAGPPVPVELTALGRYHGPAVQELLASLTPASRRIPVHLRPIPPDDESLPPSIRDGDGDGIVDALDHCPNTPRGYSVDAGGCLKLTAQPDGFVLHVEYESGLSDPDPLSMRILDDLAVRLLAAPDVYVRVEGHTDNIGIDADNLLLSEKRAVKVKDYLVELGVPADRITTVGRGEDEPIATNGTASGRRANRRIEISYQSSPPASASTE